MTSEQQHKQEWIDAWVDDYIGSDGDMSPDAARAILPEANKKAEAAWQKRNEDGPEDGPGWEGGFAWNH